MNDNHSRLGVTEMGSEREETVNCDGSGMNSVILVKFVNGNGHKIDSAPLRVEIAECQRTCGYRPCRLFWANSLSVSIWAVR